MSDTMLKESCARLFADLATRDALEASERAFPAAMWAAVEEAGLARPHLPEAQGGAGGTWLDAGTILFEAGRAPLPLPIAESIAGASLLAAAGLKVPEGPLAVAQDASLAISGGKLSGRAASVPWGADAGHVVVVAGTRVALLAKDAATATRETNLAGEPRDTLEWKSTAVLAEGALKGLDARTLGAAGRAAQMAGAIERALDVSLKYVVERKQFGRALAANQAVQQALAVLAGHSAAATIAAEHAFRALAADRDASFEIAAAKVRCGEAASMATNLAHQAHGAIGFTREYVLQQVTRRLWSWRAEFGADAYWAEWLGRYVCERGPEAFWAELVAR